MVIKTIISKTTKVFKSLCTPARIEFILTIIGAIATIITCFASFSETKYQAVCNNILPSTIVSGIFIWILNALCKGGAGIISWILVVGPLFIMLFAIFFGKSKEEFGFVGKPSKVGQVVAAAKIAAQIAAAKAALAKAAAAKAELEAKKKSEGEDEDEGENEDEEEKARKARALEKLKKDIEDIKKRAVFFIKSKGANAAMKAKVQVMAKNKIEALKKAFEINEAKIAAKRKVGVYAAKSNAPKSKELIELEKKLAKLNSKIAKQTKKCLDKCTSKKLKKELEKLKEQIKDEISDTKAENPDFS